MYKKLLEKAAKFNKIVRAESSLDALNAKAERIKNLAKEVGVNFYNLTSRKEPYLSGYPRFADNFEGFKYNNIMYWLDKCNSVYLGDRQRAKEHMISLRDEINKATDDKNKQIFYTYGYPKLEQLINELSTSEAGSNKNIPDGPDAVSTSEIKSIEPGSDLMSKLPEPTQSVVPENASKSNAPVTPPAATVKPIHKTYGLVGPTGKQITDSEQIKSIQNVLSKEPNGASIATDGIWGPKSNAALIQFQKANNCPVDGKLNAQTMAIIQHKGLNLKDFSAETYKKKMEEIVTESKSLYEIIVQSQATPSIVDHSLKNINMTPAEGYGKDNKDTEEFLHSQNKSFPEASPVVIEAKPTSLTKVLIGPKGPITDRDQIEAVQYVLSKQPIIMFDLTKIDGVWGPQSDKALKLFQKLNNIGTVMGQSGKLDDATYLILLQKAEALTSDADKVYVNNLRKINQLSSVEPTALPTSSAKTIYEMVVTAQNMDEVAKQQDAEEKAILDIIGGSFKGTYQKHYASGVMDITFIEEKTNRATLDSVIVPKLDQVTAALKKVNSNIKSIFYFYKKKDGKEDLLKKASKTIYEMVVTAQNMDEVARLQAAEHKAVLDVIGVGYNGKFSLMTNGPDIRLITFKGDRISEDELKTIEPKLLDVAVAMRKVRPIKEINFYYQPKVGDERLVKKAGFKQAQQPVVTNQYAFQQWIDENITKADKNKIANEINQEFPGDLETIRISVSVNKGALIINALVNGKPNSMAQAKVANLFKAKGFQGKLYPDGSKYDGLIVYPA